MCVEKIVDLATVNDSVNCFNVGIGSSFKNTCKYAFSNLSADLDAPSLSHQNH